MNPATGKDPWGISHTLFKWIFIVVFLIAVADTLYSLAVLYLK